MDFRTDLALERREILGVEEIPGVISKEYRAENALISEIEITNDEGAKAIGRPKGRYITIEVPDFADSAELLDGRLDAVSDRLQSLLPEEGGILVVGLGNIDITPDAFGPKCSQKIFSTRHIGKDLANSLGLFDLRPVSSLTPGVLGQTGIETAEIIVGLVKQTRPAAVITVDALAARGLPRLGRTIQMCDTGIAPGSGVGNKRSEINEKTLGVPVIAVGVPTVVDAVSLAHDLMEGADLKPKQDFSKEYSNMMVTPREVDLLIDRAAKLVSLAINTALQTSLSAEDLLGLVQ